MLRRPRHATGGGPARWALIGVLGAACFGGLVYLLVRPQPASSASQRRAAVAYRTGPIQRLIDEGGTIVEREIKPSLPDLVYAKVTPEEFRNYASGWHAGLDRARVRFDACAAPARLGRAKTLYDQAMRQYVQAVDAFSAASRAPDVKGALSAATPVADHADATWDRADKLVVSELKRLGLPERPPRPAGVQPPCQG